MARFGVDYDLLMGLDEVGLISSNPLGKKVTVERCFAKCGTLILSLNNAKGLTFQAYPLTKAGAELARVAQVQRRRDYFFAVARWLQTTKLDAVVAWAQMPNEKWADVPEELTWFKVPDEGGNAEGNANGTVSDMPKPVP
jgi:hypothetical protein